MARTTTTKAPIALLIALSAGCAQLEPAKAPVVTADTLGGPSSPITHVVIIFQENRTVDNLFNGLPGADTVAYGKNSKDQQVQLQPILLTAPYDISHKHNAFQAEYANGNLNGFDLVVSHCKRRSPCPPAGLRAYAYVPQSEVQPYFTLAEDYAFADRMFQTNQGPSFPAHQFLLSGTSAPGSTQNPDYTLRR